MARIVILLLSFTLGFSACSSPPKEESAVEAASPEGPSLFTRLGGEAGLRNFADQFIQQIALNTKLMNNPLVAGAMSKSQRDHKEKLGTLLCQISGGPCKYQGRTLKEAHSKLAITESEWKEMTRVFIQVLQRMKVPKKDRQELARRVSRFKNQIVGT